MDIIKGTKRTRTDHIIKGTKRTRMDIIKGTKRTLILSSKKQTNHKLIIIKGKKTRVLSKEPTNHKLSKEPTNHKLLSKERKPEYYQRNQRTINYQRNSFPPIKLDWHFFASFFFIEGHYAEALCRVKVSYQHSPYSWLSLNSLEVNYLLQCSIYLLSTNPYTIIKETNEP